MSEQIVQDRQGGIRTEKGGVRSAVESADPDNRGESPIPTRGQRIPKTTAGSSLRGNEGKGGGDVGLGPGQAPFDRGADGLVEDPGSLSNVGFGISDQDQILVNATAGERRIRLRQFDGSDLDAAHRDRETGSFGRTDGEVDPTSPQCPGHRQGSQITGDSDGGKVA